MENVLRGTGGIQQYLQAILGSYTPTGDSFGGADWSYIFSGIILCIFLYCILRIVGSLFK